MRWVIIDTDSRNVGYLIKTSVRSLKKIESVFLAFIFYGLLRNEPCNVSTNGAQFILNFWRLMMTQTTIKENRLNIRCDTYARQLLDKAAAYAHVSISEFVLTHALSSAELIIKEHESITLQPVDFQAFLTALDKPLQVNAALNRAFDRHSLQVKR